jgi:hypothetical protein
MVKQLANAIRCDYNFLFLYLLPIAYCLLPIAHWLQPWYSIVKNCPLEGTLGVFLPDQSNSLMTSASAL